MRNFHSEKDCVCSLFLFIPHVEHHARRFVAHGLAVFERGYPDGLPEPYKKAHVAVETRLCRDLFHAELRFRKLILCVDQPYFILVLFERNGLYLFEDVAETVVAVTYAFRKNGEVDLFVEIVLDIFFAFATTSSI